MANTVNISTTTNQVVITPSTTHTVEVNGGSADSVNIVQQPNNTLLVSSTNIPITSPGNVNINSQGTDVTVVANSSNSVTITQPSSTTVEITSNGVQGVRGETGLSGSIGPQGIQGIQGPSGSQGPQGIQGETGPSGSQGLPGTTDYPQLENIPSGIISSSIQISVLGFITSSQTLDTGSLATTGSNIFYGNQIITGSVTATSGFTGSLYGTATTSSYSYFASTASFAGSANIANDADTAAIAFESQYIQLSSLSLNNDGHPLLMVYSPTSIGKAGYGSTNLPKANPNRGTIIANSFTGSLYGSATTAISSSYAITAVSASYASNANSAITSTSSSYASTSSYAIFALETDNATTADTASYATSASYAQTATTASRVTISYYGYSGDFPIAIIPDPSSNTSSPIGLGLGGLPKVNAAVGNITATSFTGSLLGTASYATQALSSSYAATGPFLTPQLEGNINLNSSNIIGSGSILTTGDIYLSGDVSADNIYSPLVAPLNGDLVLRSSYGGTANGARITLDGDNLNANITLDPFGTGIVDVQSALTATGDITGYAFNGRIGSITGTTVSASFYPIFVSAIQPDQYLEAHSGLSYNPNSGILTATRFSGGFAGTLASDLNAQGFAKIINLPTPTNAGDAVSKNYVDSEIAGITGFATETYVQNYTNARTQDLADNYGVWVRNADYIVNTGDFNRVIPFDATLVTSTIPNFNHSSGVFQNTDSRTRRFLFQMHVAILATSGQYDEADIWFSYNGTYSGSNRRGQVNFVNGDSGVYNCMLSTSWMFTLAQNETVRCYVWAQTPYKVGGGAFGNDRSCLVEVHEIN